jgi:1,4-alpha-glucan branching enzyme
MIYKERSYEDSVVLVTFELPEAIGGQRVNLVGDFNAWNQQAMPMQRNGNGEWRLTLPLQENREFQFRYLVDGKRWYNDWQADSYVPNPYGGKNSVVTTRSEYEA